MEVVKSRMGDLEVSKAMVLAIFSASRSPEINQRRDAHRETF